MEMIQADELREIDAHRHTREITYMIYCALTEPKNREDIIRFKPLPGDILPSPQSARNGILTRLKNKGIAIDDDGKIKVNGK